MTDEEVAKHFEQWKETTQRLKDLERQRRRKPIPKAIRQKVSVMSKALVQPLCGYGYVRNAEIID